MAAERYVHKDHPKTTSDRKQMQFWMGRSRETQFAWAIFDVLTPEQQAAVLAKFGWTKVPTHGVTVPGHKDSCSKTPMNQGEGEK